ncbi:RDD family protein [Rhodanobacter lindaniclasticus]
MPSRSDALPATPCPLWRRLLALVYDVLIVLAIVMVVGLLSQLATGGQLVKGADHAQVPPWYRPLQGLVVSAYFISSWMRGGQTVGMRPWHIRVTDRAGAAPTLQQAVLRLLVAAAPMLLLMLAPTLGLRTTLWLLLAAWTAWFAVALFDPRRRALHDIVAGTELRQTD